MFQLCLNIQCQYLTGNFINSFNIVFRLEPLRSRPHRPRTPQRRRPRAHRLRRPLRPEGRPQQPQQPRRQLQVTKSWETAQGGK